MISFPLLHPRIVFGRISVDAMLVVAVTALLFATDAAHDMPDWAEMFRFDLSDLAPTPVAASPFWDSYQAAITGPGPMQSLSG